MPYSYRKEFQFIHHIGSSAVKFAVWVDIDGKVTILEPNGDSFSLVSMPLATWREVTAWVESVSPRK